MKRIKLFILVFALAFFTSGIIAQPSVNVAGKPTSTIKGVDKNGFAYESVKNDALNARIYTLKNGLKVYMSVNKNEPRIQTFIAVKVGSKNDPAETTGLAHYFEHMMFKGTKKIGTADWEKESKLIKEIEELYEVYRGETDTQKRNEIYKKIDAVSYEASKLAIPNEYDKLMKFIGSTGTNAATSNDYTYYLENIPSNQIENWARIQADRFQSPILRLFHTELETVYEEKNMSLTNDGRKANEAMLKALYSNHPYGKQTTLGTQEHLRNPSMVAINKFFDKYYVPNNYCISMSGDFNPEEAILIINKHFGNIAPKPIEPFKFEYEAPITTVKTVDVVGMEAENTRIAFRINAGQTSKEAMYADLIGSILYNGKCGLIDENVNKKQLTMGSGASTYGMNDYTALILSATPKQGQSLEEAQKILLEQINVFKKGDWDESLMEATINNYRLSQIKGQESNNSRAMQMSMSYLSGQSWEESVGELDRLSKITKKDLVDFANNMFLDNNYVIINKRQGKPEQAEKVEKPPITPIFINRDAESSFFTDIKSNKVNPIEPVFVDFNKDITRAKLKNGAEILYVQNKENKTFDLTFRYDFGELHNKRLGLMSSYINFLGTSTKTAEQISREFYNLACSYSLRVGDDVTTVSISGLTENLPKAIVLLENLLSDAKPNKEALGKLVSNILKSRKDAKAKQQSALSALQSYAMYGEKNPQTDMLSEKELSSITPEQLIADLKDLSRYEHRVLFYGDMQVNDLKNLLDKEHKSPSKLVKAPKVKRFEPLETKESKVYFTHYDAKQSYCRQFTKGGKYDAKLNPSITMYNQYFGGSMNSIVFQEMREKRSLAYQSSASYSIPSRLEDSYMNLSHIATQNDKVLDAFNAFNELFDQMPIAEQNFQLAKDGIISNIRTQRISKMGIISSFLSAERLGQKVDSRKELFEKVGKMTIKDVQAFNEKYIKNKPRTYIVLGNKDQVNLKGLEKFGKVQTLTLEQIFGY
ncbi:MAG: peptidase [Bacteroidetes bacterium]|nr:peptidase [Bacteroidota bacterium]